MNIIASYEVGLPKNLLRPNIAPYHKLLKGNQKLLRHPQFASNKPSKNNIHFCIYILTWGSLPVGNSRVASTASI